MVHKLWKKFESPLNVCDKPKIIVIKINPKQVGSTSLPKTYDRTAEYCCTKLHCLFHFCIVGVQRNEDSRAYIHGRRKNFFQGVASGGFSKIFLGGGQKW